MGCYTPSKGFAEFFGHRAQSDLGNLPRRVAAVVMAATAEAAVEVAAVEVVVAAVVAAVEAAVAATN